jgi:hypothetical protein
VLIITELKSPAKAHFWEPIQFTHDGGAAHCSLNGPAK